MNMPEIDWNEIWRSHQKQKSSDKYSKAKFWDKRAPEFVQAVSGNDFTKQFIELLNPEPWWSILDVGCAAGTLAVPLSKKVRSVTAMDPSLKMREFLKKRCDQNGIDNIRIVDGAWEQDWNDLKIEEHDVVIGARSLLVKDLASALGKAHLFARKKVFLATIVGEGPHDSRIINATGRTFRSGLDYIVVVNLLRQMGIFANVSFTYHNDRKIYADVQEALDDVRWMVLDMSEQEEDRLRIYLSKILESCEGGFLIPELKPVRWAVLSWDTKTGCDTDL